MDDAFSNQRNAASLARFIVYEVQAWMGDCLLVLDHCHTPQPNAYFLIPKIYRLYYVCGRKWSIVAVPCVMCSALVGESLVSSFESVQCHFYDSPQACGICLVKTTVKLDFLNSESLKPFHTWAVVCFALTFG